MTCFLVDDQLVQNPKIRAAIEMYGGAAIVGFWALVGSTCGARNSEGVVTAGDVAGTARSAIILDAAEMVKVLVKVGIWHPARAVERCEACSEHVTSLDVTVPRGGFLWHGWGQQQFNRMVAKDPVARAHHNRGKELSRMPDLIRDVRARDGDYCRYCAQAVKFDARRGANRGTYDHKDPNGPNTLENVVVACGHCNGEKKDRTPAEWARDGGLALLPEPDRGDRTSSPGQNAGQNVSGLTGAGARVRTGQVRSERDLAGSSPRPEAGPVRDPGLLEVTPDLALASNGHSPRNGDSA